MSKLKFNNQGQCPVCNSDNLDYMDSEFYDNDRVYFYICGDCEFEGQEVYAEVFQGHIREGL